MIGTGQNAERSGSAGAVLNGDNLRIYRAYLFSDHCRVTFRVRVGVRALGWVRNMVRVRVSG